MGTCGPQSGSRDSIHSLHLPPAFQHLYNLLSSSYPLHTQAYQSVLKLLPVDSMEFKIYMPKGPFTMGSQAVLGKVLGIVGQDPSRALHWVLMPKPTHAHGFWVGMGSILLFMGGHGWVLFPGGYGWA